MFRPSYRCERPSKTANTMSGGLSAWGCVCVCRLTLLAAVAATALLGCGGFNDTIRGYGRSAAKGVSEELPSFKEPIKKILHDALLEGDTLKQATDQATAAAVRSLTRELGEAEVQKRVDGLVEHTLNLLAQKGGETTQTLIKSAGPQLKEALRQAVTETMREASGALREAIEKQLTPATEMLARRTSEVLVASLLKALEGPLGQRLEQSAGQMGQRLISDAAMALAAPASKTAVAEFTESATRGAVRGARQGVTEGLPHHIQTALIAGLIVTGALLLLCAAGAYTLWRRYQQSTTTLALVAEKINQHDSPNLKQAIRKSAADNHVGPWLSSFLKHRGL
jgi:hypothetical protein